MSVAEEIREHGQRGMAVFSPCRRYRYWLDRKIGGDTERAVAFVMLNPSTADADQDDPTIRRCIGFARAWGAGRLIVVNAFALRATDPRKLYAADDPVGPDNIDAIKTATEVAETVVVAWGTHGGLDDHDETVLGWIESVGGKPRCLGTTAKGFPRHPLYVPAGMLPVAYEGRAARAQEKR